jgi:hypothetical protein
MAMKIFLVDHPCKVFGNKRAIDCLMGVIRGTKLIGPIVMSTTRKVEPVTESLLPAVRYQCDQEVFYTYNLCLEI